MGKRKTATVNKKEDYSNYSIVSKDVDRIIGSIAKEEPKQIEERKPIYVEKKPSPEIQEPRKQTAIEKDFVRKNEQIITDSHKSDLIETMHILSNPTNLEGNTILTNQQVIALSVINYGAKVYEIEFFKHFIQTFPRYRISGDDGRGRKELIDIANAIRNEQKEEHTRFLELMGRR